MMTGEEWDKRRIEYEANKVKEAKRIAARFKVKDMSTMELLDEVIRQIEGCNFPDCSVCMKNKKIVRELKSRIEKAGI